ncbi:hypothetical protein BGZ83_003377 [Gryganskiella cystojenkinii]|nr:hypothetical protein BGZ83_003377 [Gryganskiella cystojenkinii]
MQVLPSYFFYIPDIYLAIKSIALHNATASPALTISALPPSGFAVRSHTLDRIEYVQDPEEPSNHEANNSSSAASFASTSTTSKDITATTAVIEMPALLLKVHGAGQGEFRLSFELEGCLVQESALSSVDVVDVTQNEVETSKVQQQQPQLQHTPDMATSQTDKKSLKSLESQRGKTAATTDGSEQDLTTNTTTTTSSNEHILSQAIVSEGKLPANAIGEVKHAPPPALYFVEASSDQELHDMSKENVFQSMLKEQAISTVEFPIIHDGTATGAAPEEQEAAGGSKTHTWDWTYHSKDRVDHSPQGHKTVFAVRAVKVLSRFSFWIIDPVLSEQFAGPRYSIPQPTPSTANNRHWRRASTPEKLSSSMNRLTSFQSKLLSIPTSHSSLPSLPEAAGGGNNTNNNNNTGSTASDGSSILSPLSPDTEDGPLFRATVVECENHIRDMKASTKRIIKAAQNVLDARKSWTTAEEVFIKELEGFKPADPLLNAYLRPMTQCLSETSEKLSQQMRNLMIEPLTRFYENDIKAAESHRKSFDDESKEYYTFLSRYMAMKQDSNRKKGDADAKYERKRRHFELKRFEYWGFLLDMRVGGSKSDEVLHHLTNYSEKHSRNITDLALLADELKPSLDSISADLLESQKRAVSVRKERQERRKELADMSDEASASSQPLVKSGSSLVMNNGHNNNNSISHPQHSSGSTHGDSLSDNPSLSSSRELTGEQSDSPTGQDLKSGPLNSSTVFETSPSNTTQAVKYSGIRDLEHQDTDAGTALGRRKEGFLFATSRPSLHNNSAVLEKPNINWHKYWCVLSEGHLHEYSHWKKGATLLHNEPINLKISTVRACRNQDRRFCFEVITPKFRRVYQATSAEDMNSWINVISNAIQSLLNGTSSNQSLDTYAAAANKCQGVTADGTLTRSSMDQAMQTLPTSNSSSERGRDGNASNSGHDHARKGASESSSEQDHYGSRLLQVMRESHPYNSFCAECGAKNPDWCAINLGILICIECSGIHRSLGTHISKVRSFTLDTTSYTRDLFDFIRAVGNKISNEIWEAKLVQTATSSSGPGDTTQDNIDEVVFRKPVVNDTREYKVTFIQKKYVERAFVDKRKAQEDMDDSKEIAATKALFRAVLANDIPGVLAAFARGADLNAVQEAELEAEGGGAESVADVSESASLPPVEESDESPQVWDEDTPSLETSKSPLSSSVLSIPGARGSMGQDPVTDRQGRSSFRVMETSPLLLALRNSVPFSLDDQYEVYPMAEFMLQNGATSNLSVEVQMLDDEDADLIISTDIATGTNGSASSGPSSTSDKNGWEVDPEDIHIFRQRSNRKSLGQVVHMRGEGGATAMEYLRAKSAARGEAMPGSAPSNGNFGDVSKVPIGSSSPPTFSNIGNKSPRLRPETLAVGVNSLSAPTSVVSSPSSGPGGGYSTSVLRAPPTSIHQDIASLFQKRRVSDSGIGSGADAAARASEAAARAGGDHGMLQLPNSTESSPASQRSQYGHGSHSLTPHHHTLHSTHSRAHKVKATLSKSLRLSAAYLKNNMLKEEKEHAIPTFVTAVTASPTSTPEAVGARTATTANAAMAAETTATTLDTQRDPNGDLPLSGPFVILTKRVTSLPGQDSSSTNP